MFVLSALAAWPGHKTFPAFIFFWHIFTMHCMIGCSMELYVYVKKQWIVFSRRSKELVGYYSNTNNLILYPKKLNSL
ncbi:hypothetical protein F4815DRAFT_474761, partial [Daldinia loculata]